MGRALVDPESKGSNKSLLDRLPLAMPMPKVHGGDLRELRERGGFSQRQLARACRLTRQAISAVERREVTPRRAVAYLVGIEVMLDGSSQEPAT